jgi:hypothetical protein
MLTQGKKLIASIIVLSGLMLIWVFYSQTDRSNGNYELISPAFVDVKAQGGTAGDILNSEAGISAYFQSQGNVKLEGAKSVFRTIEVETDSYIIGSVPLDGYEEYDDPHIFVSVDGWFVAYYLVSDPVSKILNIRHYDSENRIITTKLELALRTVAAAAEVAFSSPSFYHFQYPQANSLMVIYGEWFTLELPSSFEYYERSWSHSREYMQIDDNGLNGVCSSFSACYGEIEPSQLLTDAEHQVKFSIYDGFIALVYRQP